MQHLFTIFATKNQSRGHFERHKLCEGAGVMILPTFYNFILQIQMPIGEHSLKE